MRTLTTIALTLAYIWAACALARAADVTPKTIKINSSDDGKTLVASKGDILAVEGQYSVTAPDAKILKSLGRSALENGRFWKVFDQYEAVGAGTATIKATKPSRWRTPAKSITVTVQVK